MWRTLGLYLSNRMHKGLGVLVTMLLLALSSSAALALSEAPAAGSSPAAVAAPASSVTAPSAPPVTKVVPSDETEPSAAAPSEAGAAAASPKKRRPHHKAAASTPLEVESANARLRVTQAGWVYAAPSKTSKKLEKMTIGKFVDVTGSTRYYLQVKLKNGRTGYVSPSDVELARPTDKIFLLSQDAAVLEAPNRWAKKLAEVHRSHNIHVIGIALNYLRIRMKSGLTGYVTLTAVQ